jgi:hypothetical protein
MNILCSTSITPHCTARKTFDPVYALSSSLTKPLPGGVARGTLSWGEAYAWRLSFGWTAPKLPPACDKLVPSYMATNIVNWFWVQSPNPNCTPSPSRAQGSPLSAPRNDRRLWIDKLNQCPNIILRNESRIVWGHYKQHMRKRNIWQVKWAGLDNIWITSINWLKQVSRADWGQKEDIGLQIGFYYYH